MIVGDLNLDGALIRPAKTNAPLIVDADAVLTFPAATQRFEAVGPIYSIVRSYLEPAIV